MIQIADMAIHDRSYDLSVIIRMIQSQCVAELVEGNPMEIVDVLLLLRIVLDRTTIGIPQDRGVENVVGFFHRRAVKKILSDRECPAEAHPVDVAGKKRAVLAVSLGSWGASHYGIKVNQTDLLVPKDQRIGSRGIEIREAILKAAATRTGEGEVF